ncbi:MAG: T9SS C-terminal target domain-containing protein [Ignavibacteriae bacterium]|nr:MAG: T9SS C-terminal target domain-containing protein [Ignavibacteriota bacterium]
MFNAKLGFIDAGSLRRTSDGGNTWTPIIGAGNFLDMFFIDSLKGWKCNQDMKKTTDGGLNWTTQTLPSGGNILVASMLKLAMLNKDTLWGVGGQVFYGAGQFRGMVYRTTNGGTNWMYQIPDTTIHIGTYTYIKSRGKTNLWAYTTIPTGVHTTTGGDTTWYMGIRQLSNNIPKDFILKQNYPNPFNPRTVIPYSLKSSAHVKLIAYDILGKEVQVMVDNYQQAGEYEVDFMGKFSSSGVYFYRMSVDDKVVDTKRMILIK